jgi:nitrogen fixation-related uncharacterized protein
MERKRDSMIKYYSRIVRPMAIIPVAILLLVCAACGAADDANPSTSPNESANPDSFTSDELGITIVFPSEWRDKYEIVIEDYSREENWPATISIYTDPLPSQQGMRGFIGGFVRFDREELAALRADEDWENQVFDRFPKEIIYEDDENIVFFWGPNDVQFDEGTADTHNTIFDGIRNGECEISLR